jgi:hypothetical protein
MEGSKPLLPTGFVQTLSPWKNTAPKFLRHDLRDIPVRIFICYAGRIGKEGVETQGRFAGLKLLCTVLRFQPAIQAKDGLALPMFF